MVTRLRRPARAARAAWAYAGRYLHHGQHRTGWGAHSTSHLVTMLAAGRAILAALEDGAAERPAVPCWPALPAPQADTPRGRGPAPTDGLTDDDLWPAPGITEWARPRPYVLAAPLRRQMVCGAEEVA